MARVAIFAMLPVVAILLWRDVVLERHLAALVEYDELVRQEEPRRQLAARDAVIDDALWALALREPARAMARVHEAARMPAPTAMPERAWTIAAAASCAEGEAPLRYQAWRDARAIKFCAP